MSLDQAFSTTFRHYATLFFIVAALTVPVHVVHAFVYRDVIAVREIHDSVATLEPGQQVRGVSADDLSQYRTTSWLIVAAELILIPLLAGATRAVIAREGALSVWGAWSRAISAWREPLVPLRSPVPAVAAGVVVGAGIGVMLGAIGLIASEPVGEAVAFGPIGLTAGIARAAGAPFLLVPLALAAGRTKGDG